MSKAPQTKPTVFWFAPIRSIRLTPVLGVGLLVGVVLTQTLTVLPPLWFDFSLAVCALVIVWRIPALFFGAAILIGFAWGSMRADLRLDARLAHDLEGQDLRVVGTVRDLPRPDADATHFDFDIEQAQFDDKPTALQGHVRLSWYGHAPVLAPCSRWQLLLRLKRPRGVVNPGVSDFERHALEAGSTGYRTPLVAACWGTPSGKHSGRQAKSRQREVRALLSVHSR